MRTSRTRPCPSSPLLRHPKSPHTHPRSKHASRSRRHPAHIWHFRFPTLPQGPPARGTDHHGASPAPNIQHPGIFSSQPSANRIRCFSARRCSPPLSPLPHSGHLHDALEQAAGRQEAVQQVPDSTRVARPPSTPSKRKHRTLQAIRHRPSPPKHDELPLPPQPPKQCSKGAARQDVDRRELSQGQWGGQATGDGRRVSCYDRRGDVSRYGGQAKGEERQEGR